MDEISAGHFMAIRTGVLKAWLDGERKETEGELSDIIKEQFAFFHLQFYKNQKRTFAI